jgi:GNAT superfamily N-acetyltransferase
LAKDPNKFYQAAVRPATAEDAEQINSLCHQLGYPISQEYVHQFLEKMSHQEDHAFFVSELRDGEIVGWVHVYLLPLVVMELCAEIGGIIVDDRFRLRGIGQLLINQAEGWAREKDCRVMRVRSRIEREYAHAFYTATGFKLQKTSLTFTKDLFDKNR